jgi:DNA ligase-1
MQRFGQLFAELDATTKTHAKVAALASYFRQANPHDAAWALSVLLGRRLIRAVSSTRLRQWAGEVSGYPPWLLAECHEAVGDLSETLALIVPSKAQQPSHEPLHQVIEQRILPLEAMTEPQQRVAVIAAWEVLDQRQRFLFHKLVSQSFRVGVSALLVTRALAEVAGVDPAVMAHRLTRAWKPTAADYQRLLSSDTGDTAKDPAQPYPFYLASPLDAPADTLGPIAAWQVEWKWDGIRVQILHRTATTQHITPNITLAWSRGEELITDSFPEAQAVAQMLPPGTVIDGELLAWQHDQPLPFTSLQRRLGRKHVTPMLFADPPVIVMAYDLLEHAGQDIRPLPLAERRLRLQRLVAAVAAADPSIPLQLSPSVPATEWPQLADSLAEARQRGVEGLMLKRQDSAYRVGRVRGDWWKWKVEPYTLDMVLVAAQQGSGRRAGLYTDYTFALWKDGELLPVAKAYSGLSQNEIAEVDRFIRKHTTGRHGPVRTVQPLLVFELAFEVVQESKRHKAGISVRFPRILRLRPDKKIEECDQVESLNRLILPTTNPKIPI